MALRFILGRAGSGKTTRCLEEIRAKLKSGQEGQKLILLVPEQGTFQMERELAQTPGLEGIMGVQVLSFHRLAWRVLQEVGGGSKIHLDELGKNMVIRKFLENRREDFRVFRRASELPGFAQSMGSMLSELKLYQITLHDIADFLEKEGEQPSLLLDKLWDLRLIYQDLEDYLRDTYIDPDDYLNLLAKGIHLSPTVQNAEIWIDDFNGFTPQELKVVEKLLSTAHRVSLTLTLDPNKIGQDYGLFKTTETTYQQVLELANNNQITVEKPLMLAECHRFMEAPELGFLEEKFFQLEALPSLGEANNLKIVNAQNHRAEVEWVARQIRFLCQDKGYHYKDIGVILRDFNNYDLFLETVFADNDIPFFIDRKRTVMHHPVVELIRSALEVVEGDWSYETVFRFLKTDLVNISREEVDILENYVIQYGIRGSRWYKDHGWTYQKKRELPPEQPEMALEELKQINSLRWQGIKELTAFQERVKVSQTTEELVLATYQLLADLEVPARLEDWAKQAVHEGRLEIAQEHSQIWDKTINLLEQFVETLGEENISLASFIKIMDTGLESLKLGLIPPGLDQVVIGALGRSRSSRLKVVFVLGVGDGILPARPMTEGILDDGERLYLKELGLELAPGSRERLFDEEFLIYTALTRAKEYLVLSYPLADGEGKGLRPSMVINRIKSLFPAIRELNIGFDPPGEEGADLDYICHPGKTLGYLGTKFRQAREGLPILPVWWDVYNWYLGNGQETGSLARVIAGLFHTNQVGTIDPALARKIYGNPFRASVSRLEKFNSCPFSHFTAYGLNLKEREVYGLRTPDLGQFFHSALENFAHKLNEANLEWAQLNRKQCWELTNEIVTELAPQLQGEILLSTARYRYLTGKFKKTIQRAVLTLAEHARRGKFRPLALEVAFGPNGQLPTLKLTLKDGSIMELAGRIDRIDGCAQGEKFFLRVIDYKSGNTGLNMLEVFYGLKLQLLAYLDIALTYAQKLVDTDQVVPAGVFYFHLRDPLISTSGPLTDQEIEGALLKELKMQGLVLADLDVFTLQDSLTQEGWSPILPVGIKKEGAKLLQEGAKLDPEQNCADLFYKDSKIATMEQLQGLKKHIRDLMVEGGERILAGDVQISPYQLKNSRPCAYCSFQVVCQFDLAVQGNGYRELKPLKSEEVWSNILRP